MKFERLVLVVALLSPGCSKLNASFSGDTDGGSSTTMSESTEGRTSLGPGSAAPSTTTDPNKPDPPATGTAPDSSGPEPSASDPSDSSPGVTSTGPDASSGGAPPETCPPSLRPCDPILADCPEDYRCRPHDTDMDGDLDAFGCFVRASPDSDWGCDEFCGPLSGVDSCPAELLCDPIGNGALCSPPCSPDIGCELGYCDTAGFPTQDYGICRAACDPFEQEGCAVTQMCSVSSEGTTCIEPVDDLPEGEVCEGHDQCEPTLVCAASAEGSECGGVPCCARLCSISGDDCEPDFECEPVFPKQQTSNTDLGVCMEQV